MCGGGGVHSPTVSLWLPVTAAAETGVCLYSSRGMEGETSAALTWFRLVTLDHILTLSPQEKPRLYWEGPKWGRGLIATPSVAEYKPSLSTCGLGSKMFTSGLVYRQQNSQQRCFDLNPWWDGSQCGSPSPRIYFDLWLPHLSEGPPLLLKLAVPPQLCFPQYRCRRTKQWAGDISRPEVKYISILDGKKKTTCCVIFETWLTSDVNL